MIVSEIIDAFKALIELELPNYKEAKNVFDVERNPNTNLANRYGVRSSGSTRNDDGILKHLTLDHDFEVMVIGKYTNLRKDDQKQQALAIAQNDAMNSIGAKVESQKLSLENKVLYAEFFGADEPEFFEDQNLCVTRGTFTIKYRKPIG